MSRKGSIGTSMIGYTPQESTKSGKGEKLKPMSKHWTLYRKGRSRGHWSWQPLKKTNQPKDKRGVDLISDALPFGRLWYGEPDAISKAVGYAKFFSRSHDAVIRVYDEAGNVIETHEHKGDFKEW